MKEKEIINKLDKILENQKILLSLFGQNEEEEYENTPFIHE